MAAEETHAEVRPRHIRVEARPVPMDIDIRRCAVLVVDMQNDFGAEGGGSVRISVFEADC